MIYKKNCIKCDKEMYRYKLSEARRDNWKFCSRSCSTADKNTKRRKEITGYKKCKLCETEFAFRSSLKIHPYGEVKSVIQKFCSLHCALLWRNKNANPAKTIENRARARLTAKKYLARKGMKKPIEEVRKRAKTISGANSHFWKGGLTNKNKQIRNSYEYTLWRTSVFERDDFTCVICNVRGGRLQADHIKSFAYHPELRFDINNGRTLCIECHKETDNYLHKAKKIAMAERK